MGSSDFAAEPDKDFPLISVIVPVYKVENCLGKCIESIVCQTYKNLEIILVDDGSPDSCGRICDRWGERDKRIQVIHKENGGLSDARNAGIRQAAGKYIGFVDSDDYIEPEMYEYLLTAALEANADIATCRAVNETEGQAAELNKIRHAVILNAREALYDLFVTNHYMRHAAWNKLYRRELFDDMMFPVGRLFEDAAVMYLILEKVSSVSCMDAEMYHYVQRFGSISNNTYKRESVLHRMENSLNAFRHFDGDMEMQNAAYVWNMRSAFDLYETAYWSGDFWMGRFVHAQHRKISKAGRMRELNWKEKGKNIFFLLFPQFFSILKKGKKFIRRR